MIHDDVLPAVLGSMSDNFETTLWCLFRYLRKHNKIW